MQQRIEDLTVAVDRLTDEASDLRAEMRRRTRALWAGWAVGALVLTVCLVAAFMVSLSNQEAIEENNQRWCPTLNILVPGPDDPQPTNERGRYVAEQFRSLAVGFGCVPKGRA